MRARRPHCCFDLKWDCYINRVVSRLARGNETQHRKAIVGFRYRSSQPTNRVQFCRHDIRGYLKSTRSLSGPLNKGGIQSVVFKKEFRGSQIFYHLPHKRSSFTKAYKLYHEEGKLNTGNLSLHFGVAIYCEVLVIPNPSTIER